MQRGFFLIHRSNISTYIHVTERMDGQVCPNTSRKNEGTYFFPCRSLSSKKEKKIPVKMSQMNAINVLMFHFWHFDSIKQEGSKDRSSDPWIVLRPAASAAAAGHGAGKELWPKSPWLGSPQIRGTVLEGKKNKAVAPFMPITDLGEDKTKHFWGAQLGVQRVKYSRGLKQKWNHSEALNSCIDARFCCN